MGRYIVVLLLLVSFKANAITGALMMSDMIALSFPVSDHLAQSHEGCDHTQHHKMPEHCEHSTHFLVNCEDHANCGLCSGHYFHGMLGYTIQVLPPTRYEFVLNYQYSNQPAVHPLILKPPKLLS